MEDTNNPTLQFRVLKHFEQLEPADFWPQEITDAINSLTGALSIKEFAELLTRENHNTINNLPNKRRAFEDEYNKYISDLKRMRNVFSYDVDYI